MITLDLTDKLTRLPISYGYQPVKGFPVKHFEIETTNSVRTTKQHALGEGPWDACEKLWADTSNVAKEIPPSDFVFHPGLGNDTPDINFPADSPHPWTSYMSAKGPSLPAGEEYALFGIYRTLRTPNYNGGGQQLSGSGAVVSPTDPRNEYFFKPNPANAAIDQVLRWGRRSSVIINWPAWVDWRDFNDELITWDNSAYTPRSLSLTPTSGGSLTPGQTYYIRVSAMKGGEESSASMKTLENKVNPITLLGGQTAFQVSWLVKGDDLIPPVNPGGITGYRIYIGTVPGVWLGYFSVGTPSARTFLVTTTGGGLTGGSPKDIATSGLLTQIKRFECGLFFLPPYSLANALDRICQISCADWQWSGLGTNSYRNDKIRFMAPSNRAPVFTLNLAETRIDSFSTFPIDRRSRPNQIIVNFRDRDDEFLNEAHPVILDREKLQQDDRQVKPFIIDGGTMTRSQAQRCASFYARVLCDMDQMAQMIASPKSYHVLPGDVIHVTNEVPDWTDVKFVVRKKEEHVERKNLGDYILAQVYVDNLYSDQNFDPLPKPLPAPKVDPHEAPPLVVAVLLSEVITEAKDGTAISSIHGTVTFANHHSVQRGRVWLKKPTDLQYQPTGLLLAPQANTNSDTFIINNVRPGFHRIKVVSESILGAHQGAGDGLDVAVEYSITTLGKLLGPSAPPGIPTATMGADGTVIWSFSPAPEADVAYYQALDILDVIVPGGAHIGSTRFTEPPTGAVMQRRFRAVNRSGIIGPSGAIGTFVLPTPTTPTASITYDGIRLIITINNPSEGVLYDYALANDGSGILAQNHGPRFEELNPPTASRSVTRYVRATRFGAASAWAGVTIQIPAPSAPTLVVEAVFPFNGIVTVVPPAGLNRLLIRRTIVETSTVSNFATIFTTLPFDGVAGIVDISGRFSTTPTLYVRARYEDGFGPGSNSPVISMTFPGLVGTDIAPGTLEHTAFAASLSVPRIVTSLPGLPNSAYPEKTIVILNNASNPDNGKLFRNVGGSWTKAADGADIVANTIVGGSLVAAAVGAREVAAQAIRVTHLLIGNFDNLIQDPGFELNGIGWTLGAGMSVGGVSPGVNTHGGLKFVSAVVANQYLMNDIYVDCTFGDIFTLDVWIRHTGGGSGSPVIRWYDANKVQISESLGSNTGISDVTSYVKWNATASAPSNAVYARPGFKSIGSPGWWVDDFSFRKVVGSTVIADGAILTRHLTAESISARHLVVATLSDNLLANSGFEVHTGGVLDSWLQVGATVQSFGAGQGSFLQTASLGAGASKMIAVTPGETLAIKYRAWHPGTSPLVTVYAAWRASRSTALPPYIFSASQHTPASQTTIFNGAVTTTPTDYEFTVIVPAGMFWMSLVLTSSQTANFDDVQLKRQIGRAFIADLSVDSAKIANATIHMGKVNNLTSFDYVADIAGFALLPGGVGEFNSGIKVVGVPLTEIQIRAVNSIDHTGRWRGNDTGRVPVSVIVNPKVEKSLILDDNTADVVVSAEISGYGIEDTANSDSAHRAHVDVLNKFGELVKSFPDIGYFGLGVVGFGAYDRKYADPVEEAIFKILVRNRGGYSAPIYLKGTTRSTTLPTVRLRANCPLELTATPISPASINLTWQFNSNVTVFKRQRGTTTWVQHATGVSSATPYSVTGLSELTWYEFKVSAGSGNDSNIVLVLTKQVGSAVPSFPSPSGLSGSPNGTTPTTVINLTWTRNATDNDGVEVYKDGALLTTLSASATTYQATGLTAGTAYTFKVRNKWNTGPSFSDFSNEAVVSTQSAGSPGGSAPSGLSAFNSSVESNYKATLTWTNNGAAGTISIERKLGTGGTWGVIQSGLASSTTNAIDTTVTPGPSGRTYFYRVVNSSFPTQYSNEDFVFIELYGGGDPFCLVLDTPVLMVNPDNNERFWKPIGEIEVGDIVVTVNTITKITNKAYVREFRDGFANDALFTCVAATGESVTCSELHPFCRFGNRYGEPIIHLNPGSPLLRLENDDDRLVVESTVEQIIVQPIEEPVPVRTLILGVMNHTFITGGLVSHNVKPL